MAIDLEQLPDDIAALKAMLIAADVREASSHLRAIKAETRALDLDGQIAHPKLTIAKMQRDTHGASSEKGARLIDQMELQLDELIATVAEGKAVSLLGGGDSRSESRPPPPARRALPAQLPRERVVHPAPCTCTHCGSDRLRKLGETTTETLELIPISWKVVSHVREKFSCRACEKITETPAPSHPIARGRAGPQLLAHILFSKYGAHLPLNRQSEIYAKDGIDLDVSTLADWVGACSATLQPLVDEIEKHLLAADRIHADDTTVPVLARNTCVTGRLWTYVRDDRPFAGYAAPAAFYYYAPTRGGVHPEAHLAPTAA